MEFVVSLYTIYKVQLQLINTPSHFPGVPILHISSTELVAVNEICILIKNMTSIGFHEPQLMNIITRFLQKRPFHGIRVNI
jgi:hypothetical protein